MAPSPLASFVIVLLATGISIVALTSFPRSLLFRESSCANLFPLDPASGPGAPSLVATADSVSSPRRASSSDDSPPSFVVSAPSSAPPSASSMGTAGFGFVGEPILARHSFAVDSFEPASAIVSPSSKTRRTSFKTHVASSFDRVPAMTRRRVPTSFPSAVANSLDASIGSAAPSEDDAFRAVKMCEHQIVGNRAAWYTSLSCAMLTIFVCSSVLCFSKSRTVELNSLSSWVRRVSGSVGDSAAETAGVTSRKSRTLCCASARCLAVMERSPAVRIDPAPSTSCEVRLLNTRRSSAILYTATGPRLGTRLATAR
mmetsp:Transcript_10356/g.47520  ORF Transcript_10356/g.47520 Transcript_10356/m.47520 type:complete len:314 (-) Transcript_10356:691-1632(-)